jgi:hypothetical protein
MVEWGQGKKGMGRGEEGEDMGRKQLLDVLYVDPSQISTSHRLVLRKGEVNAECR